MAKWIQMNLACVLAIVSFAWGGASPRPTPSNWLSHAEPTGISSFDTAVISTINQVRRGNWDAVSAKCTSTVIFETSELDTSDPGDEQLLFDESRVTDDNQIFSVHVKQVPVNSTEPISQFIQGQFSYFASLVESSTQNPNSVPQWTITGPKNLSGIRCGPSVWGKIASNATWRIEFGSEQSGYKIKKFVVESR